VPKEATWLGWSVEGMLAVRFDLIVPKLNTRTKNWTVMEEELEEQSILLLPLAKIRP
jgi:hypothetical protein